MITNDHKIFENVPNNTKNSTHIIFNIVMVNIPNKEHYFHHD